MFSKMELKLTLVDLVLLVSLPIRSFLFVHYLLYNNFFCLRESPHTAHLFIFWLSVSRVGTLMKLYWKARDRVTTCCVDVPSLVRVSKHNSIDQLFSEKSLWETWWVFGIEVGLNVLRRPIFSNIICSGWFYPTVEFWDWSIELSETQLNAALWR